MTIDRFKTLKDANDHNGLKNYGLHKSEELAKLMFEGTIILLRLRKEVQILFGLKEMRVLQGVALSLARSPRRVSKVSGECKSSITRPFGEYNFRY